jgi:hypothetical protein
MDILNFISWIKAGNYRDTLPAETTNLLAVGAKDPSRDDAYLSLAVNAAPLQSLYDTANVTQITSITTAVTVNAHNGTITTLPSTLTGTATTTFIVNNSKVTTASKILLTVDYTGTTGMPLVTTNGIANGSFAIKFKNASGTTTLNAVLKISYLILD